MTIYPASGNRVSTSLALRRMLTQVHGDQSAILNLQTQLSTGRRLQSASQDLPATIKILASQRQQEFRAQADKNLKSADDILTVSETSLAQAGSILNQIRGIAVEGASNTISNDQRTALLHQVDAAIERLVELGNAKFGDHFVFAGSNVRETPLKYVPGAVQFRGNHDDLNTIADYATVLAANVTANDIFGVQSEKIVGTVDLNPRPTLESSLHHLNGGAGVKLGAIRLSSGVEHTEIDLSGAHTIEDVVERLSSVSLGGRQLDVSLSGNGLHIQYEDGLGGLLRVEDVGDGVAASQLGINNTGTPQNSPVIGSDLNPILTPTTRLGQLLGGTGVPAGSSFVLHQAGVNTTINTTGLQTVEDLLNRIETSGARVHASIDPSGRYLQVQSLESGTPFSIGENGGSLASTLGLRSMMLSTRISSLNFGQGVTLNDNGNDLILTRNDGTTFEIDLGGVQTVGDVVNRINNDPNNLSGPQRIIASLQPVGNGIRLSSTVGAQPISVQSVGGSNAATGLGWTTNDQMVLQGTNQGASNVIGGRDVSQTRVEGVFTTLIQLREAIQNGQVQDMPHITESLDGDLSRLTIARAIVGTRQQNIANRLDKSADEQIRLSEIESEYLDADLASVISELAAREAALQASLQMMGQTLRMTLFDYL